MIYENRMKDGQHFPFSCAQMEGNLTFMNHCHKEMEIIYMRRGQLCVSYEGEECLLKEGDVWIAPPFGSHSIDGGDEKSVRLAILLDLDIMGWMRREDEQPEMAGLLEQTDLYSGHWEQPVTQHVRELVESMEAEFRGRGPGWQLAIKTALNELMLTILRRLPRCERRLPSRQVDKVRTILEYTALNYCGELSLEACAARAGFNPTYLSRYFHQHMGMTFQEYVKQLRIDRARWLLKSADLPITEVANACGFNNIKTFNKLFKKECGVSPSQFRKGVPGTL